MPHLTTALKDWLSQGHRKKELYETSGLSSSYITNLFEGQLPKPETFGKILASVDDEWATIFLRSYLMDEIPDGWRDRVEIAILDRPGVLQEELPTDPKERRRAILDWIDKKSEYSAAVLKMLEGIYEMAHDKG